MAGFDFLTGMLLPKGSKSRHKGCDQQQNEENKYGDCTHDNEGNQPSATLNPQSHYPAIDSDLSSTGSIIDRPGVSGSVKQALWCV
jgi:hypothetical protein